MTVPFGRGREQYDPEYGAYLQRLGDAVRSKINASNVKPDDLLAEYDRLTAAYIDWKRWQEWMAVGNGSAPE